jgi:C_GCAxxG_C_C family probable redox protein
LAIVTLSVAESTMEPTPDSLVRKSAEDFFASGLFCAESVVLAIAKAQGVDCDLLPRVASPFCSGMAATCGTCGALTGAIMGVGLALGRSTARDSVQPCYTATRRLIETFEREFGSRDCQALLGGCDLSTPEGQSMFKSQGLGKRCFRFTGRAAEIAARMIAESRG